MSQTKASEHVSNLLDELGAGVETPSKKDDNNKSLPIPSNHYSPGVTSGLEERALKLLGNGVSQEQTASALGVSPSRISQLLSISEFAQEVQNRRMAALQAHTDRDNKYDSLEDKLLEKLEKSLPLMMKPDTILKAMQIVNGAKRRGSAGDTQAKAASTNIVNIVMPKVMAESFVVNSNNRVTKAGDQNLYTMSSSTLLRQVEEANRASLPSEENTHVHSTQSDRLVEK